MPGEQEVSEIDSDRHDRWLVHVALGDDWAEARTAGTYPWSTRGRRHDQEGFVHLARIDQLDGVIERFYRDVDALVLLVIDRTLLDDPVIDEPAADGQSDGHGDEATEWFPHLYGPLPLGAVVQAVLWSASSGDASTVSPAAAVRAATASP